MNIFGINPQRLLKISKMIAMTYKGQYGKYDIGMKQKWYYVDAVQWYTCQDDNNFYICIQGSRSSQDNNQDWKDNLNVKQVKYRGFKIHKGHYKQALVLYDNVIKEVENWYTKDDQYAEVEGAILRWKQGGKKIIICGHSLGGAIAQILPLIICHTSFIDANDIIVVTEGAPRSYNKKARDWYNKNIKHSIRIVNSNDVVTRVPFKITGFWKYYHVANKLQIGSRDGWKRYLPWNYKKWIKEDVDHNPKDYVDALEKYIKER